MTRYQIAYDMLKLLLDPIPAKLYRSYVTGQQLTLPSYTITITDTQHQKVFENGFGKGAQQGFTITLRSKVPSGDNAQDIRAEMAELVEQVESLIWTMPRQIQTDSATDITYELHTAVVEFSMPPFFDTGETSGLAVVMGFMNFEIST